MDFVHLFARLKFISVMNSSAIITAQANRLIWNGKETVTSNYTVTCRQRCQIMQQHQTSFSNEIKIYHYAFRTFKFKFNSISISISSSI